MATPIKSGWSKLFKNMMLNIHVIGICLPSHSASEKHDEEKKGPYTFAHFVNFPKMCLPYLIIVAFWVTLKRQIVPVAFPPWLPLSPPIPGHVVWEPPRDMLNVSSVHVVFLSKNLAMLTIEWRNFLHACCVICISCSVHLNSTNYECKGS